MSILKFALILCFPLSCWAESSPVTYNCADNLGTILVSLQGNLLFDTNSSGNWQPAVLNQIFCAGTSLRVNANSRASIVLPNGVTLRMDADTLIHLNSVAPQKPALLELLKGFVHFLSRTPKQLTITTPIANAGPEGTEFAMYVNSTQTDLWVYEGSVRLSNDQGELRLTPHQSASAKPGLAPQYETTIKPVDAVNWSLYYPFLFAVGDNMPEGFAQIMASYRQGHADQALNLLEQSSIPKNSTNYFTLRTALLLSVGQVGQAGEAIQQRLNLQPDDAEATALQAIMLLTQNRKDQAYELALRAVKLNPDSALTYSALAYAEQSQFKPEQALSTALQAAKLAPHDALVWARVAELQLSLGKIQEARISARQATELDPQLEKTQTVMGYAYLLETDLEPAQQAFLKAIQLDSSAPLPRLGLGLAKIRNGALEAGRADIEIATVLNPGNSLLRSYLGKAYYEEKRGDLSSDELALAKERDPNDPTPYYYDAILKLTQNQPVAALRNINRALDDNQNRGVYRSGLDMDKDLAARGAAQGRIYDELGFQQQGMLQGWEALNTDPESYAAHRLLADEYNNLQRYDVARVSEQLQAQLSQPLNIAPIQPNLEETNSFLLNSLGPSTLGYNEYNPLFEYNRVSLQATGIYGGNNTVGDNVLLSGIKDNLSASFGQYNFGTNGFRTNDMYQENAYNAFIQDKLTDKLSLQFEYRHNTTLNGDTSWNFDRTNFQTQDNFLQKSSQDTYRLGGRFAYDARSTLIWSSMYQTADMPQYYNDGSGGTLNVDLSRQGFMNELQYIYSGEILHSTFGLGRLDLQYSQTNTDYIPNTVPQIDGPYQYGYRRSTLYNYSKLQLFDHLSVTLGVGADTIKYSQGISSFLVNKIDPKLGIVWNVDKSTTFRAAVFRSMSITDPQFSVGSYLPTIEPTQVAGFNQFFNDPAIGAQSWRYGAGLDYKFTDKITGGMEYSIRNVYSPFTLGPYRAERTARAYLQYTPNDMLALSLEYFFERINQPGLEQFSPYYFYTAFNYGLYNQVETHRIPLTISLFDQSGLSLKLKNSFVHQFGLFDNANTATTSRGVSDFVVTDLNLNYRLPNRHGMLTLGVNNLFNQDFNYQNTDFNNLMYAPNRILFSRLTLAF